MEGLAHINPNLLCLYVSDALQVEHVSIIATSARSEQQVGRNITVHYEYSCHK